MMLTVMKNTKSPVKFWFLKNYLSPTLQVHKNYNVIVDMIYLCRTSFSCRSYMFRNIYFLCIRPLILPHLDDWEAISETRALCRLTNTGKIAIKNHSAYGLVIFIGLSCLYPLVKTRGCWCISSHIDFSITSFACLHNSCISSTHFSLFGRLLCLIWLKSMDFNTNLYSINGQVGFIIRPKSRELFGGQLMHLSSKRLCSKVLHKDID